MLCVDDAARWLAKRAFYAVQPCRRERGSRNTLKRALHCLRCTVIDLPLSNIIKPS